MHGGIIPSLLKNTPTSFLPSLPLNLQTVQAPLFRLSHIFWFFVTLPPMPKNWIFQGTPKILKSFILNPITSVKMSQFKVLVMIEKSIVYKPFFCYILDFCFILFAKTALAPWKMSPFSFSATFLQKLRSSQTPFLNIWFKAQPLSTERGGTHYVICGHLGGLKLLWWSFMLISCQYFFL